MSKILLVTFADVLIVSCLKTHAMEYPTMSLD